MSAPADAVRRLIARSIAAHEAVAASLGINPADLRCLQLIAEEPDLAPSRLAELSGLTSGAVTGVLDRLESGRASSVATPIPMTAAKSSSASILIGWRRWPPYQPLLDSAIATTDSWGADAEDRLRSSSTHSASRSPRRPSASGRRLGVGWWATRTWRRSAKHAAAPRHRHRGALRQPRRCGARAAGADGGGDRGDRLTLFAGDAQVGSCARTSSAHRPTCARPTVRSRFATGGG